MREKEEGEREIFRCAYPAVKSPLAPWHMACGSVQAGRQELNNHFPPFFASGGWRCDASACFEDGAVRREGPQMAVTGSVQVEGRTAHSRGLHDEESKVGIDPR